MGLKLTGEIALATGRWQQKCGMPDVMEQGDAIIKNHIRVLSVEPLPLMCEGIATVINANPDMRVVANASSAQEAIRRFREHRPDVTVMDLNLPDMSGIDGTIAIRSEFPNARIVLFATLGGDIEVRRALEAGAQSYMLKTTLPIDLAEAIRQVHAGNIHLSPDLAACVAEHLNEEPLTKREIQVLELATGNRNRDIADRLLISEDTVKTHMKHILQKLGANDRTQAVIIAARRGIIQL